MMWNRKMVAGQREPGAVIRPGEMGIAHEIVARGDVTRRVIARDLRRWYVAVGQHIEQQNLTSEEAHRISALIQDTDNRLPSETIAAVRSVLGDVGAFDALVIADAVERAGRLLEYGIVDSLEAGLVKAGIKVKHTT